MLQNCNDTTALSRTEAANKLQQARNLRGAQVPLAFVF